MNTEAEILDTIRQCRAMMLKDQYPEAIAQLESALRDMTDGVAWASPPLEVSLLIALVWAYERSLFRQPDPAVEERSSALQDRLESLLESADLSPVERARGWGRLGSTALLRLRWDRAARFYERLLEAVENVLGWEGYSSALLCLGRAEDALRAVERGRTHLGSLSRSPRELRALSLCFTLTQVKACLVLGRFEEAISALDELDVGSFGPSVREELQALRVVASSARSGLVLLRRGMITVTILDKDDHGRLSVDLRDLLEALGDLTRDMLWTVSACEALGAGAEALYAAEGAGVVVRSEELLSAARQLDQVIEGVFRGYAEARVDAGPWIILAAVDSTAWDVSSEDKRVLDRVRARFGDVREAGAVGYG